MTVTDFFPKTQYIKMKATEHIYASLLHKRKQTSSEMPAEHPLSKCPATPGLWLYGPEAEVLSSRQTRCIRTNTTTLDSHNLKAIADSFLPHFLRQGHLNLFQTFQRSMASLLYFNPHTYFYPPKFRVG